MQAEHDHENRNRLSKKDHAKKTSNESDFGEAGKLVQHTAAALERPAMGYDRIKLRQFRLELLVHKEKGLQRTADIAVAARDDFVDSGLVRSGTHQNSPTLSWEHPRIIVG